MPFLLDNQAKSWMVDTYGLHRTPCVLFLIIRAHASCYLVPVMNVRMPVREGNGHAHA